MTQRLAENTLWKSALKSSACSSGVEADTLLCVTFGGIGLAFRTALKYLNSLRESRLSAKRVSYNFWSSVDDSLISLSIASIQLLRCSVGLYERLRKDFNFFIL